MADIKSLAQRLSEKLVNLSTEERKKYGSVNEQNKLLINKVHHYHTVRLQPYSGFLFDTLFGSLEP